MNFLLNFIKGIFVGVENIIPGVSGGTIAVILGIFDRLISSINSLFTNFKKSFLFLLPIGLGAVVGILALSHLLGFCLENYSFPTNYFFVGLVAGSIPLIYGKASCKGVKPGYIVSAVIAFAVVVLFSLLKDPEASVNIAEMSVINAAIFLGAGAIAAAAMVIPGISGSFVLVLLGLYPSVLAALNTFNIPLLLSLGIGIVLGVLLISKLISILMEKAYSVTYFAILGLIIGSLYSIAADPTTYASGVTVSSVIVSVITFIAGFFLALTLGRDKSAS